MKKLVSALLAAALACTAFMMTGCNSEVKEVSSNGAGSAAGSAAAASEAGSEAAKVDLSGQKLTLNGSTSMAEVCEALGAAFKEKTGADVEKGGNGSGDAPKAVDGGTALIGDLSRKLKDDENPDKYDVKQIAIDGIAVVVNKDSKVKSLTTDQIKKIFTGEIKNWKDVGGDNAQINVIGRESSSGTRDGFESIFDVKSKCKYNAEQKSTGEVANTVAGDKKAIGYISLGSVSEKVTAVAVDGVEASEANIINDTYKAHRPFIEICKKGAEDDLINAWFDFIFSEEGAKIIQDSKLIAVDKDGNPIASK